ncbi:unnamed protein product, partial [Polarella glacialis]
AAAAEALAAAQASAAEALRRESAELLQQEAALQRELGRQAVAAAAEAQQAAERRLELFNECQAGESALRESWEKIVAERAAAERRLAEQRKACEAPMAAAQKLRGVAVRAQKALQLLGSAVKGASDQRAVVLSNLAASSKVERICQEVTEDQKSDSSGTKGAAELALAIQDAQAEAHELRSGLAMSEAASQELKLALSSVASRVWLARRRAHEVPSLTAQLEAVQRQVWAVEDRQDASPPSSWALRCSLQLLSSSAEERALLQLQLREERVQQDAVLGAPYSQGSAQSLAMRVTSPKLSRWVKVASSPFQEPPGDDCVDGEEQERCDLRAEAQLLQLRLAEEGCRLPACCVGVEALEFANLFQIRQHAGPCRIGSRGLFESVAGPQKKRRVSPGPGPGPYSYKTALTFEGGGFSSVATQSAILAGLLSLAGKASTPPVLQPTLEGTGLLDKFDLLTSVSGGGWFLSCLLYSRKFLTFMELMAANPSQAGKHFMKGYMDAWLQKAQKVHGQISQVLTAPCRS